MNLKKIITFNVFRFVIGIDPGVRTGYAVWNRIDRDFTLVETDILIAAYNDLRDRMWHTDTDTDPVAFRIEDARKRGGKREKAQGAGSVKRDSKIWEEICQYHDWPYQLVPPLKNATKFNAQTFQNVTGWDGRTSQHARDAGMLVYGL